MSAIKNLTPTEMSYSIENGQLLTDNIDFKTLTKVVSGELSLVAQVETATVVGTIGAAGAGNVTVVVTANGMVNSPKTINVAVANNDTATLVAGKIITALQADPNVSAFSTVSGTGDTFAVTVKSITTNDSTMNISTANGTCSGLTAEPTSVHTTAGVSTVVLLDAIASKIIAAHAYVKSSGATATKAMLALTTDYILTSEGGIQFVTDQSLNNVLVHYRL